MDAYTCSCGTVYPLHLKDCPGCGEENPCACPDCGTIFPLDDDECPECGAERSEAPIVAQPQPTAPTFQPVEFREATPGTVRALLSGRTGSTSTLTGKLMRHIVQTYMPVTYAKAFPKEGGPKN